MQSPLIFDQPQALWLLPLAWGALWLLALRSRAGLSPESRRLAGGVRAVVVLLLVLALAGTHLVKRSKTLTTLFLLDVSQSIRPDQRAQGLEYIRRALASKGSDDRAGIVEFGRTAFLADAPSDTLQELNGLHASVAGDATDLAGALRLAGASFPADQGRKIVVLSDGNENTGSAASQIDSLRADGVRVDVAPTALSQGSSPASSPEAMVDSVDLPPRVRAASAFPAHVVVSSTVPQAARLSLLRDGVQVAEQSVMLPAGKSAWTFAQPGMAAGFHRYDAVLTPTQDGVPQNNRAFGFVSVIGKPRVLYVTDGGPGATSLPHALASQGISLETRAPGAVPTNPLALESYESIVLSDVSADELGPTQMAAIGQSASDGVGLGMIGGTDSFGAGHYGGTPLESALPVTMAAPPSRHLPTAAVVIVLDASGSMAATEGGVQKVQLGARAAVQLMTALQPGDQVAVTAVTETTSIIVPLEDASKAASARTAIEGVYAGGGGIYCRQGLADAYALLLASHAPIKHVIICADTSDSEQQDGCLAMAQEMLRDHHISTTICGIGHLTDHDVPFQRGLARAGGGQSFVVNEAADLPRFFERDVQGIQSSWFVEKPFLPRAATDPVIAGVPFGSVPPLLGYDLTTLKPGATLALATPDTHDPVFAYWRHGLGRSFAFTSDDRAHWATHWLAWPGYTRFWSQALRWSLKSSAANDLQTTVDNDAGRGHVVVDAFTPGGGFINKAALLAHVTAPDLTTSAVPLAQTAPGRYEGTFDTDQTGAYLLSVRQSNSAAAQTAGLVVPYSPEYRTIGPNLPLLAQLTDGTGGKIEPDPTRVFRDAPSWVAGIIDLSPSLLLLTALLFLADVAARRLALRPAQIRDRAARGAQSVGARVSSLRDAVAIQAPPLPAPRVDALLGRTVAPRLPGESDAPLAPAVLSRRASRRLEDENDPFPQVASLRTKPKPIAPETREE